MTRSLQTEPTTNGHTETPAPAPERPKTDFEKLLEKDFATPGMAEAAVEMRKFDQQMRKAGVYANSDFVPVHFRSKNGNCFIAIELADRLKVDALTVMQNTYIVQGKLGFQGAFTIAVINASGLFDGLLEFELACENEDGDAYDPTYKCRCVATLKGSKKVVKGPWVDWATVKREGWDGKPGSKWKTIADMMFRYRAAAFFGRTICPHLLMGFQTAEELMDTDGGDGATIPHINTGGAPKRSLQDDPTPTTGAALPPPTGGGEAAETPSPAAPAGKGKASGKKAGAAVNAEAQPVPHADDPAIKADEFSQLEVQRLRDYLLGIPKAAHEWAMGMANVKDTTACSEDDLRMVAYNAKLAELNGRKM